MRDLFLSHFLTHKSGGQGTQGAPKQQTHRACVAASLAQPCAMSTWSFSRRNGPLNFSFSFFPAPR